VEADSALLFLFLLAAGLRVALAALALAALVVLILPARLARPTLARSRLTRLLLARIALSEIPRLAHRDHSFHVSSRPRTAYLISVHEARQVIRVLPRVRAPERCALRCKMASPRSPICRFPSGV
jgi:hypothetical protein